MIGESLAHVSHHLGVLREAQLVCDEKQGKFVNYSLHPKVFRPKGPGRSVDVIDLGCCQLQLGVDFPLDERSNIS
jgi:ArsR family transcriptional regulator